MKFLSVVASALLGSAVAAPLEARIVAQEFDVSEFSASCVPHGSQCSVRFLVATNQMPYPTECSATERAVGVGSLPDFGFITCKDPAIVFSLRAAQSSWYELALADADQSLAAAKFFLATDFPRLNDGSTYHQQFTGTTRFVVQ